MKILIVSYFDDNFGDNLIRICFENILKVVLKNLNIKDYTLFKMHLKAIDYNLIKNADLILFAGGGLFGLSYLNFFEYLNDIIVAAESNNIPVVFSSIGVNNMDATEESENKLRDLLKHKCIKAISVRENIELFKHYAGNNSFLIEQVCDPAVWSKYIYYDEINKVRKEKNNKPLIGINVVRGGLFKDNNKNWKLGSEMTYLNELKELLEQSGYDYKFYTNGSFLDNNTLHYYANKYDIPNDLLAFPNSTKELVETIAQFDLVAAIRMHSSIVAYALDIPATNIVWNDKINYFYQNINYPDSAIAIDNCNAKIIFNQLKNLENINNYHADSKYLMTLYKYLYKTLSNLLKCNKDKIYTFNEVKNELINLKVPIEENTNDLELKIIKGEKHYLARFIELQDKNKEINNLKKDMESLNNNIISQEKEIKKCKSELILKTNELQEKSDIITKQVEEIKKLKNNLNRIYKKFPVRVYRKLKKICKNLLRNI